MPRDINGVYTLPAGNPVVPGTVISTNWANATLTDIADALTASITKTAADARYLKLTGGTLTGGLNIPSLNGGQLAGMRNKIINGNMDVWQRGTNFPTTVVGYTADRWAVFCDGTAYLSVQQIAINSADQPVLNANYVAAITKGGTPTSFQAIFQRIENLREFIGKTFTLSFRAYGSGTLNVTFRYSINGSAGPFTTISTTPVALTYDWTVTRSVALVCPTVDCTPASILQVDFSFTSAGVTTYLANIQLEAGTVATPFEHRPYGVELAQCQRYYQRIQYDNGFYRYVQSASSFVITSQTIPPMRATPTGAILASTLLGLSDPTIQTSAGGASFRLSGTSAGAGEVAITSATVELSAEL